MRIIGIDPGTANCGFVVLEHDHARSTTAIVELGSLRSDPDARLRDRVAELAVDLDGIIRLHRPALAVVEAPAFPRGALAAAMVWAAFAAVTGLCLAHRVELVSRNPGEWRRLLGLLAERLPPARTTDPKLRARLSRQAQVRRKASTAELMNARWPGAAALLASTPTSAREHAWDALAIATSWTDRATETTKRVAQVDLLIS